MNTGRAHRTEKPVVRLAMGWPRVGSVIAAKGPTTGDRSLRLHQYCIHTDSFF
jgi:hypothetical protein